jgi:hypothetical protein
MVKKIALTLTVAMVVFLSATPPSRIEAAFDSTGQILSVRVDHATRNVNNHYIKLITVKLNGRLIISQSLASQADAVYQDAVYKIIDARSGDKIEIEATCSMFGSKSVTITAPGRKM